MTDLWSEASRDIDAERRTQNLEMAKAASQGTWEFLALARSPQEFGDRVALAADLIATTASDHNVAVSDLVDVFNKRFALLMEAKENPFDDDQDDDSDDSDSDGSDDDSDDQSDDSDDSDSDDEDDDSSDDSDDDSGDDKDSAPPWSEKYASLAAAIRSGADPLSWGGTPFARSSARKEAADGADGEPNSEEPAPEGEPGQGEGDTLNPNDPVVPGMNGGIAETTKPRQLPEGGGLDPTMAPGMGMDGIGDPPFDPATNGGDIQQGADDLPPTQAARYRYRKVAAIAREVRRYNPTLSERRCLSVAEQVYDRYLSKHAEDMSPLLFGDRGGVEDGPATHRVKTWSPADFNPQQTKGQQPGAEEEPQEPDGGKSLLRDLGESAATSLLPRLLL